jgi:hypothetical protein
MGKDSETEDITVLINDRKRVKQLWSHVAYCSTLLMIEGSRFIVMG